MVEINLRKDPGDSSGTGKVPPPQERAGSAQGAERGKGEDSLPGGPEKD